MASGSKQPAAAATTSILTTVLTLEGHTKSIPSISYFPDGKHIVSGSYDNTSRLWDLQTGKEIEEARDVWEQEVDAVAVSRNGRWIITAGGDSNNCGEIKARDVEMGIIRTFQGHSDRINCIDISADNRLLASGAEDRTACIWSLDTGQLVAGPFKSADKVGAIRFSLDSKKLAVKSGVAKCLEVWDVETQKMDIRLGKYDRRRGGPISDAPVFWTMKDKSIVAAFSFKDENVNRIYEFDVLTLRTVGASFEGHTDTISGLALSFDSVLVSASADQTIKLWAFQSRQLLASFSIQTPRYLILSPDSSQVAYTTYDDTKIYICDTPPDILATLRPAQLTRISDPDDLPPEAMFQDLTGYITKDGEYPVARGVVGEIWKCTYSTDRRSIKVAVKALQVYRDAADHLGAAKTKKIKISIKRELRIYANLKHKNILPVYGYTNGFGSFMLVSPWVENGNLTAYLEHVGADLTLVRQFEILRDIIAGLQYLHANSVIHGHFKGPNVLIHGDGTACITDFGLSFMYSEVIGTSQDLWTSTLNGNVRWMAPELLVPEREDGSPARPSEQSDIFSFGGIMLQVLTNKIPYCHLRNDASIIMAKLKSQMPSRFHYPVLPEKYWEFIEKCWSTDPRDRPSTEAADGVIRNEFHSLSRAPENPYLAVLCDLTRYITEEGEYAAAATVDRSGEIHDLTRYITEDEEYAGAVDGFGDIHDLTTYIKKDAEYPADAGGFGEIWKCTYEKDIPSIKVAVKSLRVYADDLFGVKKEKKIKRIQRELTICANMKHKNILPVYGYTTGFGPFMAIVSLWAENGNLTTYLKRPGKALAVVERFRILNDIIAGLQYLHDNHVIHGDFNGNNVLIYGDGTACIADFGLSLRYSEVISASKAPWTSAPIQGNLPWMSPELFEEPKDGSEVRPSQQSDIYSFGGIMLQVLTNEIPYYYTTHQPTIIGWIAQSKKPDRTRYPDVPDKYWQFIEWCWSTVPQDRPPTEHVEIEIRNEFSSLLDLANS